MLQSRILNSSYIADFLDVGFDSDKIKRTIKGEVDNILGKVENKLLDDWEIQFIFRYNTVKQLLIYTRGKSYSKEKYKEITIHIPIPSTDEVDWGVRKEQEVYDKNHLDNIIDNFYRLDVDFKLYKDVHDYIIDSMRTAIKYCLTNGITINGVKLKIRENPPG
jgi:hypothetical protein